MEVFNGEKLDKFSIANETEAKSIVDALLHKNYTVTEIQKKEVKRRPYAPFTTSTMQQEASSKLYFSPKKTMQVAQGLYEGIAINGETKGLITYMRTDSISISNEGITDIRQHIEKDFGGKYLPSKPIFYASKQKNAQEAHEAIRPTDASLTPEKAKKFLKDDQYKLYNLIWRRAVASQMENAISEATKAIITHEKDSFKATGSIIIGNCEGVIPNNVENTIILSTTSGYFFIIGRNNSAKYHRGRQWRAIGNCAKPTLHAAACTLHRGDFN